MFFDQKFFFQKIPFYLTFLLPLFLVTGPFLPDLSISICAVIFLINSYKNKLYKYYRNYFFIIFIIFYLILVTSSLLSENILFSLKTSALYIRFLFFSLSTWYLLDQNSKLIKYLLFCFLIVFCFLTVDGLVQFNFGNNIFGYPYMHNRISSVFKDELILGSYSVRSLPLFLALFYVHLSNHYLSVKLKLLFYSTFAGVVLLIVLSQERTSYALLLLGVFYVLIFKIKLFWKPLLGMILASVILIVSIPELQKRLIIDTKIQLLNMQNDDTKREKGLFLFSQLHEEHMRVALMMLKNNPFFGVGPRMFKVKCHEPRYTIGEYSCTTHPHNIYMQLLAETGIIGFGYIFSLFIFFLLKSIKLFYTAKNLREDLHQIPKIFLLSFLFGTLFPIIPSGSFFNNWLLVLYYFPAGLFLWIVQKKIKIN